MSKVLGVGINDLNVNVSNKGKHIREYNLWMHMLERCYSNSKPQSYSNVIVSEEWLYLSKFKDDVSNMVGFDKEGWQLDKDILSKRNKIYSKNTCCFVPQEINSLFTTNVNKVGDLPLGVTLHKARNKYQAQCRVDGKKVYLGLFNSVDEAHNKYKDFKQQEIFRVAEKWKNELDYKVYEALIGFGKEKNFG